MSSIIHLRQGEEEITALVTEISHHTHTMYKVVFESGYENIFFNDVESGEWVEEDLGFTILAMQIGKEVKKLSQYLFHVPKILTWHKQNADGKLILFGFFNYVENHQIMYEIYNSNKKYMYTLSNKGHEEWQVLANSHEILGRINSQMAQRIIKILSLYQYNI